MTLVSQGVLPQMILLEPTASKEHCVNKVAWRLYHQENSVHSNGILEAESKLHPFRARVVQHSQHVLHERCTGIMYM